GRRFRGGHDFPPYGLAEPLRQLVRQGPTDNIVAAAWPDRHDDLDRPRRIGLRPRYARYSRQRGSASGQMQKISAGEFYFEPPSLVPLLDHLVGACGERRGHFEAERLGALEGGH